MVPALVRVAMVTACLFAGASAAFGSDEVILSPHDELQDLNRALRFETVTRPSLEGLARYRNADTLSVWYERKANAVLIVDSTRPEALRISGLPEHYRGISTAGWKKDKRFFLHVRHLTPHTGTMIYLDLTKKVATEVEHWAAN